MEMAGGSPGTLTEKQKSATNSIYHHLFIFFNVERHLGSFLALGYDG